MNTPMWGETAAILAQIDNPAPVPPPGADKITKVIGNIKWVAGLALLAGFFAGIAVWTGGRIFDHHRAGKAGTMMMLVSVVGGLFYGLGYQFITSFAGV